MFNEVLNFNIRSWWTMKQQCGAHWHHYIDKCRTSLGIRPDARRRRRRSIHVVLVIINVGCGISGCHWTSGFDGGVCILSDRSYLCRRGPATTWQGLPSCGIYVVCRSVSYYDNHNIEDHYRMMYGLHIGLGWQHQFVWPQENISRNGMYFPVGRAVS